MGEPTSFETFASILGAFVNLVKEFDLKGIGDFFDGVAKAGKAAFETSLEWTAQNPLNNVFK